MKHQKKPRAKHPKVERTFVMIKPDAVQRSLIGEIVQRYERIGLKLLALKMVVPTPEQIEKHYTLDPQWRRITGEKRIKAARDRGLPPPSEDPLEVTAQILIRLRKYMTSGPLIAMIWQGAHAVPIVRKLTGGTEPFSSDVGTIRGDFVLDSYEMADHDDRSIRNLVHASGSTDEAEKEIKLWFSEKEITHYNLAQDKILYDVNLDGILE